MMAANLRRRHPNASSEEIERLLEAWLADRPDAELGDSDGTPVPAGSAGRVASFRDLAPLHR
jgi:hypothetical protein